VKRRRGVAAAMAIGLLLAGCGTRLSQQAIRSAAQVVTSSSGSGGSGAAASAPSVASSGTSGSGGGGASGSAPSVAPSGVSGSGGSGTSGSVASSGPSGSGGSGTSGSVGSSGPSGSGGSGASGSVGSSGPSQAPGGGTVPGGCPTGEAPVMLGNVGNYDGILAPIFAGALTSLQAWVKWTNAHGGLNCHPVSLVSADDGGDPSTNITETEQMVEQDHVIAFVGDMVPLDGNASLSYLESVHVPVIGGDASSSYWYDSPVLFPEGSEVQVSTDGAARESAHEGHTKVAVFYCLEDPFCEAYYESLQSDATSDGVQVVYAGEVSLVQPSFTAECLAAQQAGATSVFEVLDGSSDARAAQDCSVQGFNPLYFTISIGVTPAIQQVPQLNGLLLGANDFPWIDNYTPAQQEFHQALAQYDPGAASSIVGSSASAWASGELVVAASKYLGTQPTSSQLFEGLWSIKGDTLGGLAPPLTFTENGYPSIGKCYWVMKLQNGNWIDVDHGQAVCE
jgi:branched-chain amino acid transport system substrate-binding protein